MRRAINAPSAGPTRPTDIYEAATEMIPDSEIRLLERQNPIAALDSTGWKVYGSVGAAELLGTKASALASRIKPMGIAKPGS